MGRLKNTVKELVCDREFWIDLALAVSPWAAFTAEHVLTGRSHIPYEYEEIIQHLARGPIGSKIVTTLVKNCKERELTPKEELAYSTLGGLLSGSLWELRQEITRHIPYLSKFTERYEFYKTVKDIFYTTVGGFIRGRYKSIKL